MYVFYYVNFRDGQKRPASLHKAGPTQGCVGRHTLGRLIWDGRDLEKFSRSRPFWNLGLSVLIYMWASLMFLKQRTRPRSCGVRKDFMCRCFMGFNCILDIEFFDQGVRSRHF